MIDLSGSQQILESLLVLGSVEEEPVGPRVADAVAEDGVQPERHLVDEVVHVAFQAPVVVAGEQDATVVVDDDPPCEMDGADARQVAPVEDMPAAEIEDDQDELRVKRPERAGFAQSHHGELVLGDPVFAGFEFGQASGDTICDGLVADLVHPQQTR